MPGKNPPSALGQSSAVEDYLERILELIDSKGYARVVDIATSIQISQASVSNMVQRLDTEGLLKYEKYRGLVLTEAGETLARNITRRHQLLTDFLTLLRLDNKVIHHDVEGMEHHISPPTLRAIEALTAQLPAANVTRATLSASFPNSDHRRRCQRFLAQFARTRWSGPSPHLNFYLGRFAEQSGCKGAARRIRRT